MCFRSGSICNVSVITYKAFAVSAFNSTLGIFNSRFGINCGYFAGVGGNNFSAFIEKYRKISCFLLEIVYNKDRNNS